MDFDSIITFLFILAFFVLPSILKQIKARKKKAPQPQKVKKKPSILGRLSEQIRQFIRELEQQAQKQRQAGKDQGTVWETLSEDEDADFSEPEPEVFEPPVTSKRQRRKPVQEISIAQPALQTSVSRTYGFKSNPLQNAIIWSEILSKPLALRDK
ncbi:MAG: hypothetical protein DRH93_00550 [Deltaproteobacteria bacterium]|nr:MAG: hypothetical protein DRH93_00550 [Deltaproteobacteria bacterium]